METSSSVSGSFRDPCGFLFRQNGAIYRQINLIYKENYDHLITSGLYNALLDAELLIPHEEVNIEGVKPTCAYKIIKPELIPFISYPYEWGFSQLKEAALTTLKIQKKSFEFGMSLKDSSAYNIQFKKGKAIFIDTLSFEKYQEGRPWVAYRQFCQHFLAPLALMSYKDIRLSQLLRLYIDGIPLDLASSLLPLSTRFKFSLLSHLYLHAKSQKHFADKTINKGRGKVKRLSFLAFMDNLEGTVSNLRLRSSVSEWADYYEDTNYSPSAFGHKKELVAAFLEKANSKDVWDLGANTGIFSRIASKKGIPTVSFDFDPLATENNYLQCLRDKETCLLPLVIDLTNPSPGIGWKNEERISLLERGPADTVFAFALIHHLAISNNIPLDELADFFNRICKTLIIEFIPKSDSQVKKLLSAREDIFPNYTQSDFEREFNKYFSIRDSVKIRDSERTLYLMAKK